MQPIAIELPYPELNVPCKSRNDVIALTPDYAGRQSETTAVMQYSYQSYIVKDTYPEIAEILEQIAISEMLHHELLASAIVASGGDPIIAGLNCFWSGSSVNYSTDIQAVLNANIQAEKQAIANYKRTITKLENKSIINLIQRIILDEELHLATFEKLLEEVQ